MFEESGKENNLSASVLQIQESKERIGLKIRDLEGAVQRLRSLASGTKMNGKHSELRFRVKSRAGQNDTYDDSAITSRSSTPSTVNSEIDEVRTILADIDRHLSALRDIEREHGTICERYTKEIMQRDEILENKNVQLKRVQNELELIQVQVHELQFKNMNIEKEMKLQFKVSFCEFFVTQK